VATKYYPQRKRPASQRHPKATGTLKKVKTATSSSSSSSTRTLRSASSSSTAVASSELTKTVLEEEEDDDEEEEYEEDQEDEEEPLMENEVDALLSQMSNRKRLSRSDHILIRKAQRLVKHQMKEHEADIVSPKTVKYEKKILHNLDTIHKKEKTTLDVLGSTAIIHDLTELNTRKSRHAVEGLVSLRMKTIIPKLVKRFPFVEDERRSAGNKNKKVSFSRMGKQALKYLRSVRVAPRISTPHLTSVAPKVRKARVARVRQEVAPLVEVQEADQATINRTETSTYRRTTRLAGLLKRQKFPVHYFKFLVDPSSFNRTVENMFDMSVTLTQSNAFMLKVVDGEIFIERRSSRQHIGQEASSSSPREKRGEELHHNSGLFSLNKHKWKRIVKHYKIKKCPITRTASDLRNGDEEEEVEEEEEEVEDEKEGEDDESSSSSTDTE